MVKKKRKVGITVQGLHLWDCRRYRFYFIEIISDSY